MRKRGLLVLCAMMHRAASAELVHTESGQSVMHAAAHCDTDQSPHARVIPPANAFVVGTVPGWMDTGNTDMRFFHNLSAAVAALDRGTVAVQTLFVGPGVYLEQVFVPPLRGPLVVQGYTCDARTYHGNTVTLRHSLSLGELLDGGGGDDNNHDKPAKNGGDGGKTANDDDTATLRLWTAAGLRVYNINVDNAFGPHTPSNGQALAVSASPASTSPSSSASSSGQGGQAFYACQFTGYQDTLLAESGPQLYVGCLVRGAVDFVFGQKAMAWLERCDVRTVGPGYITASGRATTDNPSWYVVHNSTVDAGENADGGAGGRDALVHKTYLGRPWADHARVVFQHTYLSDVVHPAGWSVWSKTGSANTAHVEFGEFGNYGPGAVGSSTTTTAKQRASFSQQLAAPVGIATVLGRSWASQWWVDSAYLT